MSGDKYEPQSHDAVLSRILANQENAAEKQRASIEFLAEQIKEMRAETRAGFDRMGNRVTSLELFRSNLKGKVAVVSAGVGLGVSVLGDWIRDKLHGS